MADASESPRLSRTHRRLLAALMGVNAVLSAWFLLRAPNLATLLVTLGWGCAAFYVGLFPMRSTKEIVQKFVSGQVSAVEATLHVLAVGCMLASLAVKLLR